MPWYRYVVKQRKTCHAARILGELQYAEWDGSSAVSVKLHTGPGPDHAVCVITSGECFWCSRKERDPENFPSRLRAACTAIKAHGARGTFAVAADKSGFISIERVADLQPTDKLLEFEGDWQQVDVLPGE
ncbi:MAG: hypothetical protein AB7K09_07710 [Planctomycetota bacterium]